MAGIDVSNPFGNERKSYKENRKAWLRNRKRYTDLTKIRLAEPRLLYPRAVHMRMLIESRGFREQKQNLIGELTGKSNP